MTGTSIRSPRKQAGSRRSRPLVGVLGLALFASACGLFGSGNESSDRSADGSLTQSGPCPTKLVIQTDWFPEPEHGGTYQLVGGGGEADHERLVYAGPLQARYRGAHGVQTVEIRAGGAAVGGKPVSELLTTDDAIFFGFVNTDDAIAARAAGRSLTGVATTLDINPQMLMWSPARHNITRFEDLAKTKAPVLHFPGLFYVDFLVSRGYVTRDQLDASYDGSPARWLASKGEIIQQGYATSEPYTYRHDLPEWRKDVDFFLIHWLGYENYPAVYTVRTERLRSDAACLKLLVPVLQQAWVDYLGEPTATNQAIIDALNTYDTFFKVSKDLTEDALGKFEEFELATNGSDATYGNFDLRRVERFLGIVTEIFRTRGTPLPPLSVGDIVTNEFIDPTISWRASARPSN